MTAARKRLELKVTQAHGELARLEELARQNLISQTEFKQAETNLEAAKLELEEKMSEAKESQAGKLPPREVQQAIFRELFSQLGVALDPPKSVFFNELTGILMVRVHGNELSVVQAAIETLGGTLVNKSAAQGQ